MSALGKAVLARAESMPEGHSITAGSMLEFGSRSNVGRTLSRLARRGKLMRAARGIYVHPVKGRFGSRPPAAEKVVESIAATKGEVAVPHGAAAANALGLTTQVPMRSVFLTNGRSRKLKLGGQVIEMRHAPEWQVKLPHRPAGNVVRALAWLGREHVPEALGKLKARVTPQEVSEIRAIGGALPAWLAEHVSHLG